MGKELEKAQLGASTMRVFCESWGNDVHANILLEILLEGLMNEEAIFVSGEPQQARDQADNGSPRELNSHVEDNRNEQSEPSADLGTEDSADYP